MECDLQAKPEPGDPYFLNPPLGETRKLLMMATLLLQGTLFDNLLVSGN
jgi:hypothetical protein